VRVLIVSEDPRERQRASTALTLDDQIELVEVDSAAAARVELARTPADVLVIDGDLTPKGGFSLLYELRADADLEGVAAIPALVMVQRETDQWLAKWARANATLPKPVDPFALAKLVRSLASTTA
jgi:DNA-binding response OmpR family regulator